MSLTDLGGGDGLPAFSTKISSFSSFFQKKKGYPLFVGCRPRQGNPGSATACDLITMNSV